MWEILGRIGLILGLIVSVGTIFGYFTKTLPLFKRLPIIQSVSSKNQQGNIQPSGTSTTQLPNRNLIIPTIIGIILFSFLVYGEDFLAHHYNLFTPFLGIVTFNDVLIGFIAIIPLYFGAVYGSWVGLEVGGIGFFIGGTMSTLRYPGGTGAWIISVGFAIVGIVAGLCELRTKGDYSRLRNIIITNIVCAIGLFIEVCFVVYVTLAVEGFNISSAPNYIFQLTIPEMLPGLIFLPFLLLSYSAITERRKLASGSVKNP